MGFFATHTVSIVRSGSTIASNLPVTMDPVSLDNWNVQVQGAIPVDLWDVETVGWNSPIPQRADYIIATSTADKNVVLNCTLYTRVFTGQNTLQFKVSSYSGTTP